MDATTRALCDAATMYGSRLNADQLRGYIDILSASGVADERLAAGVKAACRNCKFMPKPADILAALPPYAAQGQHDDDAELPPEDVAFNRVAFPLFGRYMRREISKDQFVALMRQEARRTGVEHKIHWDDFYLEGAPT